MNVEIEDNTKVTKSQIEFDHLFKRTNFLRWAHIDTMKTVVHDN